VNSGFAGFPEATLAFLADLADNNQKAWFEAHRDDYERCYLDPAKAFVSSMRSALAELSPDVRAEPRVNGSVFRVHRDVRFSTDKTPYRPHLDLLFWIGEGRSRERPGYFFRLEPRAVTFGAGFPLGLNNALLAAYRTAVADERQGVALEDAVGRAVEAGAELCAEHYKRVPRGFDPQHPRASLLRHNTIHATMQLPVSRELHSPEFVRYSVDRYRPLAHLAEWTARL
jgi:uncharacterized protein (TIGR02453 family)